MKREIGGIGTVAFQVTQHLRNNQVAKAAGYLAGLGAAPRNIPGYISAIQETCVETLPVPRKVTLASIEGFEDFNKNSFKLFSTPKEQE